MKTKLNQSKLKLTIVSAMLVGSAGFSTAGYAETDTASMAVSTAVSMSCTIAAGAMTFASYDPTATVDNDANASITSTCTAGASGNIKISQGLNPHAGSNDNIPIRRMVAAGDAASFLDYEVFSNSGRSVVWENGTGVGYTGTGSAVPLTVYGSVAAGQTSAVSGSYSDTVTVSINY
jgi:spore coat protein U-like protein